MWNTSASPQSHVGCICTASGQLVIPLVMNSFCRKIGDMDDVAVVVVVVVVVWSKMDSCGGGGGGGGGGGTYPPGGGPPMQDG